MVGIVSQELHFDEKLKQKLNLYVIFVMRNQQL